MKKKILKRFSILSVAFILVLLEIGASKANEIALSKKSLCEWKDVYSSHHAEVLLKSGTQKFIKVEYPEIYGMSGIGNLPNQLENTVGFYIDYKEQSSSKGRFGEPGTITLLLDVINSSPMTSLPAKAFSSDPDAEISSIFKVSRTQIDVPNGYKRLTLLREYETISGKRKDIFIDDFSARILMSPSRTSLAPDLSDGSFLVCSKESSVPVPRCDFVFSVHPFVAEVSVSRKELDNLDMVRNAIINFSECVIEYFPKE